MSIVVDLEGIDFEISNVTFVNGLTLDKVKIKYNWLLNAKVKDAIVGEDDRGIVWYFGDWFCGEWLDGTWYSGNFYDGVWKNGLWYSYKLNKFDVLNEKFFINQTGDQYSHFQNGIWLNGIFYRGTFGVNSGESWVDYELYSGGTYPTYRIAGEVIGGNTQYTEKNLATWMDGIFQDGLMYDSIWNNGRHINGYVENSKWINGLWYNGTFNGHTWHDGYWYNGDFINGDWLNGTFTKLNSSVVSRFGNTILNTTDNSAICNWYNGTWKNGEWFSGYVIDSNKTPIASTDNYLSVWHDGTWMNGIWYGGHFKKGEWKNGIWKNGIFGYLKSTSWIEPQLVSVRNNYPSLISDTNSRECLELGDTWSGDTISPTLTIDSNLVISSNTANTEYEWVNYIQNIVIGTVQLSGLTAVTYSPGIYTSLSAISFYQGEVISFQFDAYSNTVSTSVTYNYDFNEIDEWNDYRFYVKNGVVESYYNVSAITYVSANTWLMSFTDWDDNVNSAMTNLEVVVKRKIKLEEGTGSGMTYWQFSSTQSYTGSINPAWNITAPPNPQFVKYVGTTLPSFVVGDYVYINQEPGYINEEYNSICEIISTGGTVGNYYIVTSQKYRPSITTATYSSSAGKIVKYLGLYYDRSEIVEDGTSIYFQEFDFDFDFVINSASTLINGYSVKYDTRIIDNNCTSLYSYGYLHNYVWLPLKDLTLEKIIGVNLSYYSPTYDTAYYNRNGTNGTTLYYQNLASTYPRIEEGKNKNSDVIDETVYLGGIDDLWDMNGLESFYPVSEGFNSDLYNPTLISTAISQLRIGFNFLLNNTISQQMFISNVKIKVYYSNEDEIPIWRNGTWYKGTWYNGDFYDGTYLSGMWLKGNFYNGKLSSDYR